MQEFTPIQYLQLDIANLFGKDKLTWDERLAWFKENENNLLSLTEQADSPHEYYAAVMNYPRALRGEVNHHPIQLDSTSSGLQWLSVLTGDRKTAAYCNVLNTGKREDAYTALYHKFCERNGSNEHITRAMVKKAVMVSFYGGESIPKELFGEDVESFYKLMEEECPLAWAVKEFLTAQWNSEVFSYGWVMPDNFNVHIKVYCPKEIEFSYCDRDFSTTVYVNAPNSQGRAYSANCIHSCDALAVREITALAMHNPKHIANIKNDSLKETNERNQKMVETLLEHYQASDFLSARILDYLDKETVKLVPTDALEELLSLVPKKPFQVACVHDAFFVLPNYGNDIRKLYIAQLAKVAKSNLLQFMLKGLLHKSIAIKEQNDMWKDVLNSEYALS